MSIKNKIKRLTEESKQLPSAFDEGFKINRNIEQLEDRTRKSVSRITTKDVGKDKGKYLLAIYGFDTEKFLARPLSNIKIQRFEPLEPLADTDIEGYLRHHHDIMLLTSLEESKKETCLRFRQNHANKLISDWEQIKYYLVETLSHQESGLFDLTSATPSRSGGLSSTYKKPTPAIGAPSSSTKKKGFFSTLFGSRDEQEDEADDIEQGLQEPVWKLTGKGIGRNDIERKMMGYGQIICNFNQNVNIGQTFDLLKLFKGVAKVVEDRLRTEIVDCWKLLGRMFENTPTSSTWPLKFRRIYGAKRFLENQFKSVMRIFLEKNAGEIQVGKEIGTGPLRDFRLLWKLRYGSDPSQWPRNIEPVYDDCNCPIWALLYFSIRSGTFETAIDIATLAKSVLEPDFLVTLKEYLSTGRVSSTSRLTVCRKIAHDVSKDPFKRSIYSLLSNTQLLIPEVVISTSDWLWFHLCLLHPSDSEFQPRKGKQALVIDDEDEDDDGEEEDDYCFEEEEKQEEEQQQQKVQQRVYSGKLLAMRAKIEKFGGAAYFDKDGRDPLLYFQVLLITLQFEKAISYLASTDEYFVEAIHFAISLHIVDPLVFRTKRTQTNNNHYFFIQLLRKYVRRFASGSPLLAIQYYGLLGNTDLRNQCLKDLLLETREFILFLGDTLESIEMPSSPRRGARRRRKLREGELLKVVKDQEIVKEIIENAARESEENGNYEDAVKLYDYVDDRIRVMKILIKRLSQVLTKQTAEREALLLLGNTLFQKYVNVDTNNNVSVNNKNIGNLNVSMNVLNVRKDKMNYYFLTFKQLLHLVAFFDLFYADNYDAAIAEIENASIIPIDPSEMDEKVKAFEYLDEGIRRNFAEILLANMECLRSQYSVFMKNLRQTATLTRPSSAPSASPGAGIAPRRDPQMEILRKKAKTLIAFAGRIEFNMPADSHARLIDMEFFMN